MRNFPIAVSALALAIPAAAGAQPYPDDPDAEIEAHADIGRALPSPREAEAMGRRMGDVMGAMMDVDVGPLIDAIDPGRRDRRRGGERTLGEIAGRGDPHYREHMRRSIDAISLGMGEMAVRMVVLAPALERSLADLERNIEAATRGLTPDGPDHGDDWDD